jgi:uncharacterized protein DUF6498
MPITVLFLIAVNLIPLFGVLFFGWSLFSIKFLYWIENGIIGFFNIPKIALGETGRLTGLFWRRGEDLTGGW